MTNPIGSDVYQNAIAFVRQLEEARSKQQWSARWNDWLDADPVHGQAVRAIERAYEFLGIPTQHSRVVKWTSPVPAEIEKAKSQTECWLEVLAENSSDPPEMLWPEFCEWLDQHAEFTSGFRRSPHTYRVAVAFLVDVHGPMQDRAVSLAWVQRLSDERYRTPRRVALFRRWLAGDSRPETRWNRLIGLVIDFWYRAKRHSDSSYIWG